MSKDLRALILNVGLGGGLGLLLIYLVVRDWGEMIAPITIWIVLFLGGLLKLYLDMKADQS